MSILEQYEIVEYINNTFTSPCKKCKMVSFSSTIMKNILMKLRAVPEKMPLLVSAGGSTCDVINSIVFIHITVRILFSGH